MSDHNGGWATPGPAGLIALAIACFMFFAVLTGTVESTAAPLVGIWLLGGFVVQLVVGLIELKEGHVLGGNVFLFFSAFFMLSGGLSMLFKYFAALNGWPVDTHIEGWAWLPMWITICLWTPAYLKSAPAVMGSIVAILAVGTGFITFMDMGVLSHDYAVFTGYLCIVAGSMAVWVAAAGVLGATFGRPVLPVGEPIIKSKVG